MSLQGRAQPMIQKLTLILVSSLVLLGTADRYAEAQQFRAEDFERGPRLRLQTANRSKSGIQQNGNYLKVAR